MQLKPVPSILIFALFCLGKTSFAQTGVIDSALSLSEVVVTTVEQRTHLAGTSTRVRKAPPVFNKSSLVQEMNTIPGIRFEERSPGSYRINIRGSSLRSPFGVRNVKVYWNDIPFTDPGGNTYFNQFVAANLNTLTVFKGPASSLYGQGTGGVITIDNKPASNTTGVEYLAGSYDYHSLMAKALWGNDSAGSMVTFTHNQGSGYREQSAMRRDNVSWVSEIINKKHSLNTSVLYTEMYYQTPGGLTLKEFQQNPRTSRPAVGSFPSAKAINAAIWQKTFTAGVTHHYTFSNSLTHKITVYGAYAQVKNSAVRNFERRHEPHFGARTMLSFHKKFGVSGSHLFRWDNGAEFQQGYFNTQVANNMSGAPDTLQTNDDISSTVYNYISNANITLNNKWMFVAGASINGNRLRFTRLSEYPVLQQIFQYNEEFAPRLAVMRRFQREWSVAANISKGFSPPTVAELLPSTGVITPLNAEHGWNYEMIVRKNILPLSIRADLSAYIFKLTDALVQRRDEAGADYFINAGEIDQKGLEAHLSQIVNAGSAGVFDYFENRLAYTFSHFRYDNFIRGASDFTGNKVPGIPNHSIAWRGNIYFKRGLQAGLSYYYASKIFMNDANSEATNPYHLLGARVGYTKTLAERLNIYIYSGADNLLNQVYSLGNDINAAAGRYYNVAPGRNYYVGVALEFNKKASRQ